VLLELPYGGKVQQALPLTTKLTIQKKDKHRSEALELEVLELEKNKREKQEIKFSKVVMPGFCFNVRNTRSDRKPTKLVFTI